MTRQTESDKLLEKFVKDHIPFTALKKAGFFTTEKKRDYKGIAKRVCDFFGYESIYEYSAIEIRAQLSFPRTLEVNEKGELITQPFITVFPSHLD